MMGRAAQKGAGTEELIDQAGDNALMVFPLKRLYEGGKGIYYGVRNNDPEQIGSSLAAGASAFVRTGAKENPLIEKTKTDKFPAIANNYVNLAAINNKAPSGTGSFSHPNSANTTWRIEGVEWNKASLPDKSVGALDAKTLQVPGITDSKPSSSKRSIQSEKYKDIDKLSLESESYGTAGTGIKNKNGQLTDNACGMACGQKLLAEQDVQVFQSNLTRGFYKGLTPDRLANNMNRFSNNWEGGMIEPVNKHQLSSLFNNKGKFIARLGGNPGHFVMVESFSSKNVKYWDPADGAYKSMSPDKFADLTTGIVYKEK